MKKVLTTTFFLLICVILFAQNRTEHESAINKQVDAMIYSWNHHNYDDLKNYTTENIDWVNVVGMWWKGRKAAGAGKFSRPEFSFFLKEACF